MTDISRRKPGYNLMVKLHEIQSPHEPSALGRFFGYSALNPEAVSWWRGIQGEQKVGEELDQLITEGYIVLHSVPIGKNESDIDHVVISPAGMVYTINTKHHNGQRVTAYERGINVNGQNQPYYRNSKYEAGRVGNLFRTKLGVNVKVQPVLVFFRADLRVKGTPEVVVLDSYELTSWIKSQEPVYGVSKVNLEVVASSDFWTSKTVTFEPDREEVYEWYEKFKENQIAAVQVRALWVVLGVVGIVGFFIGMASIFTLLSNLI